MMTLIIKLSIENFAIKQFAYSRVFLITLYYLQSSKRFIFSSHSKSLFHTMKKLSYFSRRHHRQV